MRSVTMLDEIWNALPADARRRIEKLASDEKKSLADEMVFLLGVGINTLAPFFSPFGS